MLKSTRTVVSCDGVWQRGVLHFGGNNQQRTCCVISVSAELRVMLCRHGLIG